ncbi:hypothetical protein TCAL_01880 [Tigriopus californicus]|uniref:KIX domain-containing protein n=1 Tax=Tigriopus californicus TaxID=6832 RepID=A0A553P7M7_TIGCA|nr:protein cbp-1-like [Tigriopus californicus]TRY73669.1 hypothetical protein TCAL_01880 [Tigriopus californicus]|eukprot:TCALIF_01880-PA protein Name:"Similar to Ep300 Histone acetyltransferase p300 (Mus musculus)" AED:0.00 eAED:0.00 QI:245/1/1/1/0.33/0.5/4/272/149
MEQSNPALSPLSPLGLFTVAPSPSQNPNTTALPMPSTKEWQFSVAIDLRNHLVAQIVHSIYPMDIPETAIDEHLQHLIAHAKYIESDSFNEAASRVDYYQTVANKIHKIRKGLEARSQERQAAQGGNTLEGGTQIPPQTNSQNQTGTPQ